MQKWLFKILVCSVNVFILAYILPGIYIVDFFTAILVAIVLSLLDAFVKPLLVLFTLPATIVTSVFLCYQCRDHTARRLFCTRIQGKQFLARFTVWRPRFPSSIRWYTGGLFPDDDSARKA